MSTYLELVNKVLKRLNEVTLTESSFNGVVGIHAQAKAAINDSLREIDAEHDNWPFNAYENTQILTPGTVEYAWPTTFKLADWLSFQIQKDDTLNIGSRTLRILDRDEWYKRYRDADTDAGSSGRGIPDYVFKTHGNGFGVTPSPDEAYTINYRYYALFQELENHDDECVIPEAFDHVIVNGAMKYMYIYLDNGEMANLVNGMQFKPALASMRKLLVNDELTLNDTRVRY